jgi:prepilin-type N-terminal cleavage/methylation domain-containing protein
LCLGAGKGGRNSAARRRDGFTLVEVIVVLVILAILAAIAIPALTGYIDKANDKQYIAMARNFAVAERAVFDEAYAEGKFNTPAGTKAIITGQSSVTESNSFEHTEKIKFFYTNDVSIAAYGTGEQHEIYRRAATLLGASDLSMYELSTSGAGFQAVFFFGAYSPDTTLSNADGFIYMYRPEGAAAGKPFIFVTYKADRVPLSENKYSEFSHKKIFFAGRLVYNPDAGYEVYHLVNL